MTEEPPAGIAVEAVTDWLAARVDGLRPPLGFDVIEGGRSNLTYRVTDDRQRTLILRRPPLHGVLESAHDMGREHRIIAALRHTDVPVPATIGYEPDHAVTGAPFYAMELVPGIVVRDAETARTSLDAGARARAAESLVDVLVALHEVDPDDVGLGDLARREDYVARQLRRWRGQLAKARTRDLPLLDEVHDRLAADIPPQGPATIVHGDYRLDNLILSPGGDVRAVLDWELTTLGDPMADLGQLMVYWSEAGDETIPLLSSPTTVEGFPSRREVAERYAAASGRDISELDFFVAFGRWKIAIILEGVYARFSSGAYGETDASFRRFGEVVLRLAESAADAATRAGR